MAACCLLVVTCAQQHEGLLSRQPVKGKHFYIPKLNYLSIHVNSLRGWLSFDRKILSQSHLKLFCMEFTCFCFVSIRLLQQFSL